MDLYYFVKVLKPLEARYQAAVENFNQKNVYMEEGVRKSVIDLLESMTGVVQGCHVTTVHQLFAWMRPTVASLVHLLSLYHNYNQVCLYFFFYLKKNFYYFCSVN